MGPEVPDTGLTRHGHVPVPILLVLLVLLPIGPIGWALTRHAAVAQSRPAKTLAQIAREAGCRLAEFQDGARAPPHAARRSPASHNRTGKRGGGVAANDRCAFVESGTFAADPRCCFSAVR